MKSLIANQNVRTGKKCFIGFVDFCVSSAFVEKTDDTILLLFKSLIAHEICGNIN